MLIFQNKSLCSKIECLEAELSEIKKESERKEIRIEALVKIFENVSLNIYNLNQAITKLSPGGVLKESFPDSLNVSYEILANILEKDKPFREDFMNDQIKSLLNSFEANSMKLMSNLINIISYERQVKTDVQNCLQEVMNENIKKEFVNLREENDGLKKLYLTSYEDSKKNLKEAQEGRVQYLLLESKLKEKEKKIEELERIKFNLTRRINTHPSLPYVFFKKKMFNYMAHNHECVCHICDAKFSTSNYVDPLTEAAHSVFKSDDVLMKTDNNLEINNNLPVVAQLMSENEALKTQLVEKHEIIESMKIQNITEEKITNSKTFKRILKDVEEYLNLLFKLKDSNQELVLKNQTLLKEKENELKSIETTFNERIKEYEDSLIVEKKVNENIKNHNEILILQIKSIEEELKVAKSNDVRAIMENFYKEKENYVKRIETLNNKLREYESKYEKECERNKYQAVEAKSDALALKVDLDLTLQKKLDYINKLEAELKQERNYNKINIEELEVNEKGLMELNKKVKVLTSQLKDSEEKIAKMTNEHTKSMEIIKRFQEEREISKTQVKLFDEKIKLELELRYKLEQEIKNIKAYSNNIEEFIKSKEDELERVKREFENSLNEIYTYKENESVLSKVIEGLKQSTARTLLELDLLKSKYENVCKLKKIDTKSTGNNQLNYVDLQNSYEQLEATLNIYKVIFIF